MSVYRSLEADMHGSRSSRRCFGTVENSKFGTETPDDAVVVATNKVSSTEPIKAVDAGPCHR